LWNRTAKAFVICCRWAHLGERWIIARPMKNRSDKRIQESMECKHSNKKKKKKKKRAAWTLSPFVALKPPMRFLSLRLSSSCLNAATRAISLQFFDCLSIGRSDQGLNSRIWHSLTSHRLFRGSTFGKPAVLVSPARGKLPLIWSTSRRHNPRNICNDAFGWQT
jgi:hypothetical protein